MDLVVKGFLLALVCTEAIATRKSWVSWEMIRQRGLFLWFRFHTSLVSGSWVTHHRMYKGGIFHPFLFFYVCVELSRGGIILCGIADPLMISSFLNNQQQSSFTWFVINLLRIWYFLCWLFHLHLFDIKDLQSMGSVK